MSGGPVTGTNYYSVTGGFWSLISVVQTPGVPNLLIVPNGANSVKILWPNTGSYTLQQKRQSRRWQLDDERLCHHERFWQELLHHHTASGEFIFPLEESVAAAAGASGVENEAVLPRRGAALGLEPGRRRARFAAA